MAEYKTPGVYIKEKNAFGTSVVEAETAIPAFIGLTEKAKLREDGDLNNVPWKISSMNEFIQYFGEGPKLDITVKIDNSDGTNYKLSVTGENKYPLYQQMQLFFANGGSTCYVVSVKNEEKEEKKEVKAETANGSNANQEVANNTNTTDENNTNQPGMNDTGQKKEDEVPSDRLTTKMVEDALKKLEKEREVTLIVVPEAVSSNDSASIQQSMMKHCNDMGNRFAILDVPKDETNSPLDKRIEKFQNTVTNYFSYGAAYFPWLNTTVLSDRDLTGDMFVWDDFKFIYMKQLKKMDTAFYSIIQSFCGKKDTIKLERGKAENEEYSIPDDNKLKYTFNFSDYSEVKKNTDEYPIFDVNEKGEKVDKDEEKIKGTFEIIDLQQTTEKKDEKEVVKDVTLTIVWYSKDRLLNKDNLTDRINLHQALYNASPLYKQAIQGVLKQLNLLPPSAAMASIYTMVDHSRGVWKAPANVSLNYVDSPAENLDDDEQANLNAPMNGKAVNVIRLFRGEGVKVWGARTLDGNSLDWRYINVRRTLLFLEESVKNAARAYVFEPNDAGTWINMKCMMENFLRSVWKRGGLAGSTPEEAFEVHVGLGDTMTGDDILEGSMRITVLVAVTHPAEFIEITFQQQMQKS